MRYLDKEAEEAEAAAVLIQARIRGYQVRACSSLLAPSCSLLAPCSLAPLLDSMSQLVIFDSPQLAADPSGPDHPSA